MEDKPILRAERALGRLMVGDFIIGHPLSKDTDFGGRYGSNRQSAVRVINYGSPADSKFTIHGVIESDPQRFLADVRDRTLSSDPRLHYDTFLGRFLDQLFQPNPEYAFAQEISSREEGDLVRFKANYIAALSDNRFGREEFAVLIGLYCLYRADDLELVQFGGPSVETLKKPL
ncbi:MAG: hypothetical protein AABX04_08480 [Nanoarchaeota archaeon]